jgi:hypothetical protein
MTWKLHDGTESSLSSAMMSKDIVVNGAWEYLRTGDSYFDNHAVNAWDIINFAPCYNGLPTDFDADKVISGISRYFPFNEVQRMDENLDYWIALEGCQGILSKLENKHTEWEMRCLMSYLQRPVVRMSAIIDAIAIDARQKGFSLELDPAFFNDNNPIYKDSWITLPLLKKEDRQTTNFIPIVLRSSLTPADYLISFAKMCGLVFRYDARSKRIQVTTRNSFYEGNIIDMTDRIDVGGLSISPMLVDSKWYQLGGQTIGEDAELYRQDYGIDYGVQRINTGYDFNSEVSELTKDIPFISAADVTERNYTHAEYWYGDFSFGSQAHPVLRVDNITQKMFSENTGEEKDFPFSSKYLTASLWKDNYADWLPKVQFHSADNKAVAGEHCILLYDGWKVSPSVNNTGRSLRAIYYVADNHPDTMVLNEGKGCWNLDPNHTIATTELPSFRRRSGEYSMDWGKSIEVFTNEATDGVLSLYDRYWRAYLTDRYDVDTKRMRCKVNLSGLQVGQDLMRNFFYYDNVIWVLNKIENHSLSTSDLTDCEFIKVKSMESYTNGQII